MYIFSAVYHFIINIIIDGNFLFSGVSSYQMFKISIFACNWRYVCFVCYFIKFRRAYREKINIQIYKCDWNNNNLLILILYLLHIHPISYFTLLNLLLLLLFLIIYIYGYCYHIVNVCVIWFDALTNLNVVRNILYIYILTHVTCYCCNKICY